MNGGLWESEFTDPMPDDTTYADFALAREKKWAGDDIRTQTLLVSDIQALYDAKPLEGIAELLDKEQAALHALYERRTELELLTSGDFINGQTNNRS